jgi:hypothetical protein
MPDERLYRSLLLAWSNHSPESVSALELSAKAKDYGVPEELEAQRMRARLALIRKDAAEQPELLRYYAHFLTQSYAHQRSVFHRPAAGELEAALERLIEIDPGNQRVYRLHLAELAWDRKDDRACFEFAQKALSTDTRTLGRIQFDLDRTAPHRVLAKMIESLWWAGKPAEAWELCQQTKEQGYLTPESTKEVPLLGIVCRKVETFVNESRSKPRP